MLRVVCVCFTDNDYPNSNEYKITHSISKNNYYKTIRVYIDSLMDTQCTPVKLPG